MGNGYDNLPSDPYDDLSRRLEAVNRRLDELERPTGTQFYQAVAELEATVAELETTTAELSDTVTYLDSLVGVAAFGSTTYTAVTGDTWASTNRPSVTIETPSGKLLVTVSALVAAGSGGFMAATFSIAGVVNRDTQISAVTGGTLSGNANMLAAGPLGTIAGSFTQLVTGLTPNTSITVQFEARAVTSLGGFTGAMITAAVVG